jgi:hypothetical protein
LTRTAIRPFKGTVAAGLALAEKLFSLSKEIKVVGSISG